MIVRRCTSLIITVKNEHSNNCVTAVLQSSWKTISAAMKFVDDDDNDDEAIEFVQYLGRRISEVTNEPLETQYPFQRLSMAVQRGNAIAFKSTFIADNC